MNTQTFLPVVFYLPHPLECLRWMVSKNTSVELSFLQVINVNIVIAGYQKKINIHGAHFGDSLGSNLS